MIDTRAWHFTTDRLRDGRSIPAVGVPLWHEGPVQICKSGLHASVRLVDALKYAPGLRLHAVHMSEIVDAQEDKIVARERTILASRAVDLRVVVRFTIECTCLVFFAAGLDDDRLIEACHLADAGDFSGAAAAARAGAARAAAGAAWAAAADAIIEARAIALLWGAP